MSAEPWKKWAAESVRGLCMPEQPVLSEALKAFAALLDAEQRGDRCVLPEQVRNIEIIAWRFKGWHAVKEGTVKPEGQGQTQEAAILDLARKLRSQ